MSKTSTLMILLLSIIGLIGCKEGLVDSCPPIEGGFSINNGDYHTELTTVSLNIAVNNADEMRFSNNDKTWSDWELYSITKEWDLERGAGVKTVYGEFRYRHSLRQIKKSEIITVTDNKNMLLESIQQTGAASIDLVHAITTDNDNNVYITGESNGNLDGNTNPNPGYCSMFLLKYNFSGQKEWTRFHTLGSAYAITSDGTNIYIAGTTDDRIFVGKYNSSGDELWSHQLGSPDQDAAFGITVDGANNIFITGHTYGNLGNANAGGSDIFITKYNSSGELEWVRQTGSSKNDFARGIKIGNTGNIYITGFTRGSLGATANAGEEDIFLAEFDSAGNNVKIEQYGTSSSDMAYGLAIDNTDAIYVTGFTGGPFAANLAGGGDAFLLKYNNSSCEWVRQFGGSNYDQGYAIAIDGNNNICVTGFFENTLTGFDVFLSKYSSLGELQYLNVFGSSELDMGMGIATNDDNDIYITGGTTGNMGQINAGWYDIFLTRHYQ